MKSPPFHGSRNSHAAPPARKQRYGIRRLLAAALLCCGLVACGDASFFVSFRSGIVVSDPSCSSSGGSFDLRETGGLLVIVAFESDTVIVRSGGGGGCGALRRGGVVRVSGRESGGVLEADEIVVE